MKPPPLGQWAAGQTITRAQVRELDRRAIEEFGIPGVVLMENAGRGAAEIIFQTCDRQRGPVAIVCGGGNNGGDGLVIARHLSNREAAVRIFLATDPQKLTGDALIQYQIVKKMNIPCLTLITPAAIDQHRNELRASSVIVDAVLGTGFSGEVRPPIDQVIQEINAAHDCGVAVVAIDLPSGLDCDTGRPSAATIRADQTITFVAPKRGFLAPEAKPFLGKLHVVDIGAPAALLRIVSTLEVGSAPE